MSAERQIPGGVFVNETTQYQEQIPGAQFINEGVSVSGLTPPATSRFFLAT